MSRQKTYLANGKTLSTDTVLVRIRGETRRNIKKMCAHNGLSMIEYLDRLIMKEVLKKDD